MRRQSIMGFPARNAVTGAEVPDRQCSVWGSPRTTQTPHGHAQLELDKNGGAHGGRKVDTNTQGLGQPSCLKPCVVQETRALCKRREQWKGVPSSVVGVFWGICHSKNKDNCHDYTDISLCLQLEAKPTVPPPPTITYTPALSRIPGLWLSKCQRILTLSLSGIAEKVPVLSEYRAFCFSFPLSPSCKSMFSHFTFYRSPAAK